MKIVPHLLTSFLKLTLAFFLVVSCDGCRRRAKPSPEAVGTETTAEPSAPQVVQAGGSIVIIAPAKPITNNVAPPPRVDAKTGQLILQGDTPVVRKRTATE